FSAFAIADSRHVRTALAMRLRENSRSASALATFLPRINCATRLSFCGEIRSILLTALASFSPRSRSRWRLPMTLLFYPLACRRCGRCCSRRRSARCRRGAGALGLTVRRMAIEHPARRKLAELVADHFLGHQHGDVLLAVVDPEIKSDKLRQDGRAAAPDLDHLVTTGGARGFRLAQQIPVDEWTLPT